MIAMIVLVLTGCGGQRQTHIQTPMRPAPLIQGTPLLKEQTAVTQTEVRSVTVNQTLVQAPIGEVPPSAQMKADPSAKHGADSRATEKEKLGDNKSPHIEERQGKYSRIRVEPYVDSNGNKTQHEMVADHLMVTFKPGVDEAGVRKTAQDLGFGVRRRIGKTSTYLLDFPAKNADALPQARAKIAKSPSVATAEPDFIVHALINPNDALLVAQYSLNNTGQTGGTNDADIDAPEAWNYGTGNRAVKVGVIDTGIDYTHPELAANIWTNPKEIPNNKIDDDANGYVDDVHGWNFYGDNNDPRDDHYHGTHCAGTIGALGNNGVGVSGVCWQVTLVPLKFLSSGGSGSLSDAVEAIRYATSIGVRLTSNSWGGGGYSQAMKDAIDAANAANILFVAAAGNSASNNDKTPMYPASYASQNIISVAATDHQDNMAKFSSYGLTTVDVGAPGVSILSTFPATMTTSMYGYQTSYGTISGTSMATPHVAGACALLWSQAPTLTAVQVKARIMKRSDPKSSLTGKIAGRGRLNVNNLVNPNWVLLPPGVVLSSMTAVGNNNGSFEPGEALPLSPTFENAGEVAATNLVTTLTTTNPYVAILDGTQTVPSVAPDGTTSAPSAFRIQINAAAPDETRIEFTVSMNDQFGRQSTGKWSLVVAKTQQQAHAEITFAPGEMLTDHVRDIVYLTDKTYNRVIAIDMAQGMQVAKAALAGSPNVTGNVLASTSGCADMAESLDGTRLYVALPADRKIQVFTLPGLVSSSVITCNFVPESLATGENNRLYVGSTEPYGKLRQLDGITGQVLTSTWGYSYSPHTILRTNKAGTRLYVGEGGSTYFGYIDEYDIALGKIPLFSGWDYYSANFLQDFAIDEQNKRVYTMNRDADGVQVTDMVTGVSATWSLGIPSGAAVTLNQTGTGLFASAPGINQNHDVRKFLRSDGLAAADYQLLQADAGAHSMFARHLRVARNGTLLGAKYLATGNPTAGIAGNRYFLGVVGLSRIIVESPPNVPATVSLASNGTSFAAPASIAMTATAFDKDGAVTKVDFYQGSTWIGSDATIPYTLSWTSVPAGAYALTAKATDNDGAVTTSLPVNVTVSNVSLNWSASADFSGTQSHRNWSYLDGNASPLTWNATTNKWEKVGQAYLLLWGNGCHPGPALGVMRRWTAPQAGSLTINGNVSDADSGGGDGVVAIIRKNGVEVWRTSLANGNATGVNFSIPTSVAIGDRVDFLINPGTNNSNDSTAFNPTLTLFPTGSASASVNVADPEPDLPVGAG
jgi:subtilisin family serine protease